MKTILNHVILSIKPAYAQAIMSGLKKVEFRKKVFKRPVDKIFVYSSAPEQRIIGFFTIAEIIEDEPKKLWAKFNTVGGIDKNDFFNYYKNSRTGFSIKVGQVERFHNEINPKFFFKKFYPPQSYMYLTEDIATNIISNVAKNNQENKVVKSEMSVLSDFDTPNPIELIRTLMKKNNLKQKKLASALELSPSTISRMLNYRQKLSKRSISKLVNYFKIPQEMLERPYNIPVV